MAQPAAESKHNGSIPSRYAAKVVNSGYADVKAFGSCDSRFKSHWNENPGPGSYDHDVHGHLLKKSPSLSKKGFGNAFVSKTEKGVYPDKPRAPGPGAYEIKGMDYIDMNKPSSAFTHSGNGRVPFPDPRICKRNIPGPSDYTPAEYNPPLLVKKPSATFISASKRDSFLNRENGVPAAGRYNVADVELKPIPTFFWSKSTYKRFQNMGMDNKVPGPGAYFDEIKGKEMEHEVLESNARTCGAVRGVQYIGKLNDKPIAAKHTFGADKERFKHSFMGRLDLKAQIPGPGTYNCKAFGDLNKRPLTASVVPFGASGVRLARTSKHGVPGPAYYCPKNPRGRPPTQNLDQHWQ